MAVSPIAKLNDGLAFEAVCLIKFPTTHPVPAPAPVILPDVPIVKKLFPVISLPEIKFSTPFIVFDPLEVTPAALFIVTLFSPNAGNSNDVVIAVVPS